MNNDVDHYDNPSLLDKYLNSFQDAQKVSEITAAE